MSLDPEDVYVHVQFVAHGEEPWEARLPILPQPDHRVLFRGVPYLVVGQPTWVLRDEPNGAFYDLVRVIVRRWDQ